MFQNGANVLLLGNLNSDIQTIFVKIWLCSSSKRVQHLVNMGSSYFRMWKGFLQKAHTWTPLGWKFDESIFRHLAEFNDYFLSHPNIFVKCPGLKKKIGETFSSKSSRLFSFSLPGPRWMWAQQEKRERRNKEKVPTFYFFLLCCVKPMCLYMSLYCVPSRRERPFGLYTWIEMGECCPILPLLSNFNKIHDCAIIGQATQVRGMSH